MSGNSASTRRDRRAAERAARKQKVALADRRPAWQSPMALLSVGAIVIGVVIVVSALIANGAFSSQTPVQTPGIPGPPVSLVHARSLGNADAPVKIDVWADFQCPVCKVMTDSIEPLLVNKYVTNGTVYLTFKDRAFIGPESVDAALAARYSEAKGPGFWPMHDILFANQGALENKGAFSRPRLADMAAAIGITDREAFLKGLDDPALVAAVGTEDQQGASLGIAQTPTLVINGSIQPGIPDWSSLSSTIDQLVAAASASPGASSSPAASPAATASPASTAAPASASPAPGS